jgi:molecular chaperone GrpE
MERERTDHYRHATGALVARLLPVLDNFERALVAARGGGDREALRAGIEMVYRQFLDELRREGLRDIESLGLAFDPEVHEAVATDADSPLPANTVVEEMQRGFYFHDRVLRPALVRVSVEGGTDPSHREDA